MKTLREMLNELFNGKNGYSFSGIFPVNIKWGILQYGKGDNQICPFPEKVEYIFPKKVELEKEIDLMINIHKVYPAIKILKRRKQEEVKKCCWKLRKETVEDLDKFIEEVEHVLFEMVYSGRRFEILDAQTGIDGLENALFEHIKVSEEAPVRSMFACHGDSIFMRVTLD